MDVKNGFQRLYNKMSNIIKRAYITLPSSDSQAYQTTQINYFGKTVYTQTIYPYGMSANAPANTLMILFNANAHEENLIGIPYSAAERFKNLAVGEVIVGSPVTGSYVKFLQNGNIEIVTAVDITATCKNATITASNNVNVAVTNECNITAKTINFTADNINLTSGTHTSKFGSGGNFEFACTNFKVNGHVELGSDGAAIARVGDQVTVGGSTGTITSGGSNKST